MSRSIDNELDLREPESAAASRMPLSQGRVNGGSSDSTRAKLAGIIDRSGDGKPGMNEFIARLEKSGVAVLPSIQSSGKLNGMSYRFEGTTFNGSAIGRSYTARGLQLKKGVDFQPERDQAALAVAVDRGGMRRDIADRPDGPDRTPRDSRTRSRDTGLTQSQQDLLAEIGKFRTVATADLVAHRYAGNNGKFDREMRHVIERGLAERRVITHERGMKSETVVVLTASGRQLLRRANTKEKGEGAQEFYAGFVKPSEAPHDIGIYKMYQQEAARIERDGGTVRRVVLDFELKKRVYRELNKVDVSREAGDPAARKEKIADLNGLSVIEGRVVFPDLRIEYETRDQEMAKVDLELATGHYKASQIETKRAAGLKIYSPDSGLGSPAHHDTEIVSGLLSM